MTLWGCPTEITASALTIHKIATLPHIIFFPLGSNYARRVDLLWVSEETVKTNSTETAHRFYESLENHRDCIFVTKEPMAVLLFNSPAVIVIFKAVKY